MNRKKQIFHLEDSKIAQKILKKILGDDVDISFASSKEEALFKIEERPRVDCFIIDYSLFDGTGVEFIEHIRTLEMYKKTPVLFQSSNMSNNLAYKAMKAGANESISKLISSTELREVVTRHIESPHTVSVALTDVEIVCACWIMNNRFFQYCPEFDIKVEGGSTVEAEQKMRSAINVELKLKEVFGVTKIDSFTHQIKMV